MKRTRTAVNATAAVIRSEMQPNNPRPAKRVLDRRNVEAIRLRDYHDGNATPIEMVTMFLQDVERATRCDISGATMLSWATVDGVLQRIEKDRHLRRYPNESGLEEYAWMP